MKSVLLLKAVQKMDRVGFVSIVLVLAAVIFTIAYTFLVNNQLGYLTVVSGEVNVSDGITDIPARNGSLTAQNARTLLKTSQGIASLKMQDGSIVIIDSNTVIEFNRRIESDPEKYFAFNLVKGRVLVINDNDNQLSTQLFIGGDNAARVYKAAMGLEVTTEDSIREMVDCLSGQCLVYGVYLLTSGQNALIGPSGTLEVIGKARYEIWMLLGSASKPNPVLANILAGIFPAISSTISPSDVPKEGEAVIPIIGDSIWTSTASSTSTRDISKTPSPTRTKFVFTPEYPGLTDFPEWILPPTASSSSTLTPVRENTVTPGKTSTPFMTVVPTHTTNPGQTSTPQPIPTPTVTSSPNPTATLTLTDMPIPTLTPSPTVTPTSTDEPTLTPTPNPTVTPTATDLPIPTRTRNPTHTPKPTNTPQLTPTPNPTKTPIPTEVPTQTPIPIPTETPIPTQTPIPIPTETPIPTQTPIPNPTETPIPTQTPVPIPSETPTQL